MQVRTVTHTPRPGSRIVRTHCGAEQSKPPPYAQPSPPACLSPWCLQVIPCENSSNAAPGPCLFHLSPRPSHSLAQVENKELFLMSPSPGHIQSMTKSWFGHTQTLQCVCFSPSSQPPAAFTGALCFHPHQCFQLKSNLAEPLMGMTARPARLPFPSGFTLLLSGTAPTALPADAPHCLPPLSGCLPSSVPGHSDPGGQKAPPSSPQQSTCGIFTHTLFPVLGPLEGLPRWLPKSLLL